MKNKKNFKKLVPGAMAAVLCICISVAAASRAGLFRDVRNWHGAVTGTEYVQATEEIRVTAAVEREGLAVTAVLLSPETVPYCEAGTLTVGRYQIVDATGRVVAEGEGDAAAEVVNGVAVMQLPLTGVPAGEYRLRIGSFVGGKKADQPLRISGSWECVFTD